MKKNETKPIIECLEKMKAEAINVIDISKKTSVANYYIFATGTSKTQCQSIASYICKNLKDKCGLRRIDGMQNGNWIILDFADIVVHIMTSEVREAYNLEDYWINCKEVD